MTTGFGGPDALVEDDTADPFYDEGHIAGVWWDICGVNVRTVAEAASLIDDLLDRQTLPHHGAALRGALTTWWGPPLRVEQYTSGHLRVDFHASSGRARVRWLPTGELGTEPGLDPLREPAVVMESSERPPVTIPDDQMTASVPGARRAIREYVETGQRPSSLTWRPLTSGIGG